VRALLQDGRQQQLAEAFRAELTGDPLPYAPGYNIAPTTAQPVVRQARATNQREIVPMRWGLVGFGTAGIDPKRSTFNARAEGLEQSSLWKRPLHKQLDRKSDKAAFRFTVGEEPVFGLAGLWDAWKAPDGHWLQSFTIITTDPSTVAEPIHNRMPAILLPKHYDEWLDREEIERPPVHLLRPFESNEMLIHTAHPKVGNVRNQGRRC